MAPTGQTAAEETLGTLGRIDAKLDRLLHDFRQIAVEQRLMQRAMGTAGAGATGLRVQLGNIHAEMARTQRYLDGIETRLSRIERRLDLVEAP